MMPAESRNSLSWPEVWPKEWVIAILSSPGRMDRHQHVFRPLTQLRQTHILNTVQPRRYLDIGCGQCGPLFHALQNAVKAPDETVCVDPFVPPIGTSPTPFRHIPADIHDPPANLGGPFDLVTGMHMGYRSYDLVKLFAVVRDVLAPDAVACIDFWTDVIVQESWAWGNEDRLAVFLKGIHGGGAQEAKPAPDPQPYEDELARVKAAAATARLELVGTFPFLHRALAREAYFWHGNPDASQHQAVEIDIVEAISQDPRRATPGEAGYFTAILRR